jgi:integrase
VLSHTVTAPLCWAPGPSPAICDLQPRPSWRVLGEAALPEIGEDDPDHPDGQPKRALRAATWRALIGLLAVTGMRQGEACRLRRDDVDLEAGTLVIADSKFGKSRLVFVHPTAITALRAYEQARDQAFPELEAATFLVNSRGAPLDGYNTQHTFAVLVAAAGIQAPPGRRAPRHGGQRRGRAVNGITSGTSFMFQADAAAR